MDSDINVGDYVKFLDQKGGGRVISISEHNVLIISSDGFEEKHPIHTLLKVDYHSEKLLRSTYIPANYLKNSKQKVQDFMFKSKSNLVWEIDIHIENIKDDFFGMTNHEIITLQLQKCEDVIHNALKAKIRKLVIIHGKGQGVLRNEVHQLLQSFRLDFKDADYLQYSGGATDVFFR